MYLLLVYIIDLIFFQGVYLSSSYQGIHQVSRVGAASPAHTCGKILVGDELVQINYQTVVSLNHYSIFLKVYFTKKVT